MFKKAIALFIFFVVNASAIFASTVQISSLKEMDGELKKSDKKTLIVFDVDEVLITTEDHFIHPYADKVFLPLLGQAMLNAVTPEEKREVEEKLSLSITQPKRPLIEESSPKFIKKLQKKGFKVIALTSCPTGKFGHVPKFEHWRIEHLKELDISFASSFPKMGRHDFTEIAVSGKPAPVYEEGILFSPGYEKGKVLKAFFEKSNFYPSKVIFIDDRSENLDSVEAEMKALNIEFKGYHYTGAERFFKELDEALLNHQFDHLMRNGEWLTDTEVQERLLKVNVQ